MDKKFLEFWGNLLINAARSQEQFENLAETARLGFAAAEAQMKLFRELYGLEDSGSDFANSEWWKKTFDEFCKSYGEFLALLGVVPKAEYDELASKVDALKKRCADLEEKAREGRTGETPFDEKRAVKNINDLIRTQSEQFQELMKSFGMAYKIDNSGKSGKGKK